MTKIGVETEEKAPLPPTPTSPTPYQMMIPAPVFAPTPPLNNAAEMRQSKVWYVLSILASIFCCLPFGVIGIVHAMMSQHDGEYGRVLSQKGRLRQARCWTCWAFTLGLLMIVGTILGALYQYGYFETFYGWCGTDSLYYGYNTTTDFNQMDYYYL